MFPVGRGSTSTCLGAQPGYMGFPSAQLVPSLAALPDPAAPSAPWFISSDACVMRCQGSLCGQLGSWHEDPPDHWVPGSEDTQTLGKVFENKGGWEPKGYLGSSLSIEAGGEWTSLTSHHRALPLTPDYVG